MRLIDADALKPRFVHGRFDEQYVSESDIQNAPTVSPDMAQVLAYECGKSERKRGQWVHDIAYYDEDGCPCIVSRCSGCGEAYPESNFCPNCGADMRGKSNEYI